MPDFEDLLLLGSDGFFLFHELLLALDDFLVLLDNLLKGFLHLPLLANELLLALYELLPQFCNLCLALCNLHLPVCYVFFL